MIICLRRLSNSRIRDFEFDLPGNIHIHVHTSIYNIMFILYYRFLRFLKYRVIVDFSSV